MKATLLSLFLGIALFRLVALILGCFYGPYIYAVLTVGGLYLTIDCWLAYIIYAADDEDSALDASSAERYVRLFWCAINVLGVGGLIAAIVLFIVHLGFWSMLYAPIHFVTFVFISCLVVLCITAIGLLCSGVGKSEHSAAPAAYRKV